MEKQETLVNKIAQSGLITIDLEDYWGSETIVAFDLKDYLFKGLVLMEKPFREALQQIDWSAYQNKTVALYCSADALIPMWAYMLVASYLSKQQANFFFGNNTETEEQLLLKNIEAALQQNNYTEAKVILKGCGKKPVPASAYTLASKLLLPVVKSLMFGEPCSTVPVYKK
jgi:hypothetical protein